jgi:acetoin utilization deacetylase AcuC-like enzyme
VSALDTAEGGAVGRLLGRAWPVGRRRPAPVEVVYHPGYELPLSGLAFDARRATLLVSFLEEARPLPPGRAPDGPQAVRPAKAARPGRGLLASQHLHAPRPASWRELRRVHTDEYLESLRDPATLSAVVGVELTLREGDRVVELERLMTGGTLLALQLARDRQGVAVNLGGGFHHAHAGRGAGFCLFNDLAVAVAAMRDGGDASRVLVVDLDLHDGDGTRALFADDPAVHTYSIHNRHWSSPRAERDTAIELAGAVDDATYLRVLRETLPPLVAGFDPELAFYVAGVDPAADDAIGNWRITAAGMLERDRAVMELLRGGPRAQRPVVVVLGGGYGPGSWRYHARFLAWLLSGTAIEPPPTEELTLRAYRRAARTLSPSTLAGTAAGDDWGLTLEDLGAVSGDPAGENRFLGYYSTQGVELALERLGFLDRLRQLGYDHPLVELDLAGAAGQTLRVWGGTSGRARRELLVELRARRDRATAPGLELLAIEWLLLQNPRGRFTAERPALPGQKHPGLGVLGDVMALLVLVCDRLGLDGIVFVPSQYHLAAQARKLVRFLQPEHEALLRDVAAALAPLPLAAATARVAAGVVVDADTGRPLAWPAMPMVLPVSAALAARVSGEAYEQAVAAAGRRRFVVREPPPAPRR